MNRIYTLAVVASLGTAFAVGCDSGDKGGAKGKAAAKADAKGKAKAGDAGDKAAKPDAKAAPDGATKKVADAADGGAPADAAPSDEEVLDALDKRVTRVAKLAEQIEAKPEDADNILEAAELDREEFDALVYAIGADPDLSQQYQLARAGK